MKIDKKKLAAVFIIIILGAVAIFVYFGYQKANFVSTIDARVTADMVDITPPQSGKLTDWQGDEGEDVTQSDKLGTVEAGTAVGSINAPISGKLVQVNVRQGQSVSASQTVAVIADFDHLYVSANIEETKINQLKVGMGVELRLDAFPEKVFFGKVESIGEAANSVFSLITSSSSNGNYTKITQLIPVKIEFADKYAEDFKLGMNVDVKIHIK